MDEIKESKKYRIDFKKYSGIYESVPIAEDEIRKGNVIEAFGILHGIIEMQLLAVWSMFCVMRGFGKQFNPIIGGDDSARIFDFNAYVDLLYQVNMISKDAKSALKNFHDGRNDVMHNLVHLLKRSKKIKESVIEVKFKDGLRASKFLQQAMEDQLKLWSTLNKPENSIQRNEPTVDKKKK